MSATQTTNGKAFEFAVVREFCSNSNAIASIDEPYKNTKRSYDSLDSGLQNDLDSAARVSYRAIAKLEPMIESNSGQALEAYIQSDSSGIEGDVRDVVLKSGKWEIGISCKHNHSAVKHSRLSDSIDFGESWLGIPCSDEYWSAVRPLFEEMRRISQDSNHTATWPDDKAERYYVPVLNAFIAELKRLDRDNPGIVPSRLVHYLLGNNDFYKVITNDQGRYVRLEAVNINGTLGKAANGKKPLVSIKKLQLPSMIFHVDFLPGSSNKIIVVCDNGWQISMRIHNASSKVEPSLKFDVQLDSVPNSIFSQVLPWDSTCL